MSTPSNYGMRSPDGRWWWDGQQWQPVPQTQRQLSPDGRWEWDGSRWLPVAQPQPEPAAQPAPGYGQAQGQPAQPYGAVPEHRSPAQHGYVTGGQLSPDGRWRWDGTRWVPAEQGAPAQAAARPVSPDGHWEWDGGRWVPRTRAAAEAYGLPFPGDQAGAAAPAPQPAGAAAGGFGAAAAPATELPRPQLSPGQGSPAAPDPAGPAQVERWRTPDTAPAAAEPPAEAPTEEPAAGEGLPPT